MTYFLFEVLHENSPPHPVISRIGAPMHPNDIRMYIRAYNMRLPCCPMPHHRASKLVFRLSIAHYLLSVTKITSLTFSLSPPGRSRWRLRVHARARAPMHTGRFPDTHVSRIHAISTILSKLIITRSRTGLAHMIRSSLPRRNIGLDRTVRNLLADIETEYRAKRQFSGGT